MLEKHDYFSLNEILATQSRIPCKFQRDLPRMGKLNPSHETDDLTAGTKLELPLWLAQELAKGQRPVAAVSVPKVYSKPYRDILEADPCAVDLCKWSVYFYHVGNYVRDLSLSDKAEIIKALQNTFKARFRQLMDLSGNSHCSVSAASRLDKLERQVFEAAFRSKKQMDDWMITSGHQLKPADVVVNLKKRKRVNDLELD